MLSHVAAWETLETNKDKNEASNKTIDEDKSNAEREDSCEDALSNDEDDELLALRIVALESMKLKARKIKKEPDVQVKDLLSKRVKCKQIKKEPEEVKIHAKMSEDHVKTAVKIDPEDFPQIKTEDSEKVKSAWKTCANKAPMRSNYKIHVQSAHMEDKIDCE